MPQATASHQAPPPQPVRPRRTSAALPRRGGKATAPWHKTALTLALCVGIGMGPMLVPGPSLAQVRLPQLGDGAELSAGAERELGDNIIRAFYRDPSYLDDPVLHTYVTDIVQALTTAAHARGDLSDELHERFAWRVLLGRDTSINAFALPGGYMGVHLGLLAVVGSRDELASVLAHEISHVTQRHIARMIGQERRNLPLLIGSMVLGALAAGSNPQAANALILGGQAAVMQSQLGFSRDMEREADRAGFNLLAPAGFSPQGAAAMFERLQQANRLNDQGSWPYLRTHPLSSERIADMQARIPHGQPIAPTAEHAMMAARAQILSAPGTQRLRQWLALPDTPQFATLDAPQQLGRLYAATLCALHLRERVMAQRMWQRLHERTQTLHAAHPTQYRPALRQSLLLGVELALTAQQTQRAAQHLQALDALDARPNADGKAAPALRDTSRPALLLRSQLWLATGQAQTASDALQVWVSDHPDDASAWRLLADAWQAQHQPLRSLHAQAEAYAAHMDYAAAIDRLRAAQDAAQQSSHGGAYVDASIIDARLRTLESAQRLLHSQPR